MPPGESLTLNPPTPTTPDSDSGGLLPSMSGLSVMGSLPATSPHKGALMSPRSHLGMPPHVPLILVPLLRHGRIQWILALCWTAFCVRIMHESVNRVRVDLQPLFLYEAFLYYNPLLMIALMVWLWGINLYGFSHSRVSYAKVFDLDHNHLNARDIWQIAGGLTLAILTSMAAFMYSFSHSTSSSIAAMQPVLVYIGLPLVLSLPVDVLYAPSRYYFLNTLWRLTFPLQPISFADFFVADILTSMAKVISDLERSVCRMSNAQVATLASFDPEDVCGSHSVMIPLVLAYPYVCRFFQCLRQFSDTKDKTTLLNALKYSTAFPVIILSALKYHVAIEQWRSVYRPLWLCASVLNTCYSYYWDIARDWDFSLFSGNACSGRNPLLRNNLHYSRRWVYYWAICSNLLLRASWTYKLSSHLRNNLVTVVVVATLEMVRRFQWVFFRVENEWNKMTMRAAASSESLKDMGGSGQEDEMRPLVTGSNRD